MVCKAFSIVLLSAFILISEARVSYATDNKEVKVDRVSSTVKILRSKGYLAQDYYIKVENGKYILNLVRATNPLIVAGNQSKGASSPEPILFIHGLFNNANSFFWINDRVEPKDHRAYYGVNGNELKELLRDDPGGRSLVFTTLNFGHEVWFLNRRPTSDTYLAQPNQMSGDHQTLLNRIFKIDDEYWKFSLDEQALYDVPETIDFILDKSGKKKLSIVGNSCGSTLVLMALTDKPDLSDKIHKTLLWAPVVDLKFGVYPGITDSIVLALLPFVSRLPGRAYPPQSLIPFIERFVYTYCNNFMRPILCNPLFDLYGKGSAQLLIKHLTPQNHWCDSINFSEVAQFYQTVAKEKEHFYDYKKPKQNLNTYGQLDSPIYNVSRINSKSLTFWFGNTDQFGRWENFLTTKDRLKVPIEVHHISEPGVFFNHFAFNLHENTSNLIVIPSLETLFSTRSTSDKLKE